MRSKRNGSEGKEISNLTSMKVYTQYTPHIRAAATRFGKQLHDDIYLVIPFQLDARSSQSIPPAPPARHGLAPIAPLRKRISELLGITNRKTERALTKR